MKIIVKCVQCGRDTKKKQSEITKHESGRLFCSHKCSGIFNGAENANVRGRKVRICVECNKEFFKRKKDLSTDSRCSSCVFNLKEKTSSNFKEMTIGEFRASRKDETKWRIKSDISMLNRAWNKHLLAYDCQVCGYNKVIELAHIKSIASFGQDVPLKIIHSDTNIAVLCPNHHKELDRGFLDLKDIKSRDQLVPNEIEKVSTYKKTRKCSCGAPMDLTSKVCRDCYYTVHCAIPVSKEELEKLVWEAPATELCKRFNITNPMIGRWCKTYGIKKPWRGYWKQKEWKKIPTDVAPDTLNHSDFYGERYTRTLKNDGKL